MFSTYSSAMGTDEYFLVHFTIMAVYVVETTNKIKFTDNFHSIYHQNSKYLLRSFNTDIGAIHL